MSKKLEKIQFNLVQKYEEIYKKSVQFLKEKGVEVCEIKYEKHITYSISKVKEMK